MDVKSTWHQMDHVHGYLDYFPKPPLGGRPNTKPVDCGTQNVHNCWFILYYHVWGPTWIEIHWNSIWLRVWLHMASHYTWGSVTTLHDFGGVLGRPLDTLLWALTNSWSWLLAHEVALILLRWHCQLVLHVDGWGCSVEVLLCNSSLEREDGI